MLPEPEKNLINDVVLIDTGSSDEEDEDGNGRKQKRNRKSVVEQPFQSAGAFSIHQNQTFESRSFWKAGDYVVVSSKSSPPEGYLEHARVNPKFLHSNATSHKWAFGAISELLDNAVDEISNGATVVKVDVIYTKKDKSPALLFQDDGGGMNPDCMRQCMSLGYSSKKGNTTIGQYGNGFKTSTMRLGADVIVFSRAIRGSRVTQSIGLLSYTFLRRTGQDDVIVPMVDFEIRGNRAYPIIYSSQDDWSSNLKLIMEWSPFASKNELLQQFDDIGVRGTKIIIYNLWLDDDGVLELDFDNDEEDIRLGDDFKHGKLLKEHNSHNKLIESHISYQIHFSLRAYASILYLRKFTNFHIILRGKPVQQYIVPEDLNFSEVVMYRPKLGLGKTSEEVSVETTIGFVKEAPNLGVSGFNVYHKNRLIRPFWKVTADGSHCGRSVVGVIEANFIEPAHDKQDFERSALFIRLEAWLKKLINNYWRKNCHLVGIWSTVPEIRNMQKETRDDQPITRRKTGLPNECPTEATLEEETYLDQPVIGLPAPNMLQSLGSGQPACSSRGGELLDGFSPTLVHQICEENIQLFVRRDAHIQKNTELKNTIEGLEKELQEFKRKCSELSSHIANQRKQLLAKHENGKLLIKEKTLT